MSVPYTSILRSRTSSKFLNLLETSTSLIFTEIPWPVGAKAFVSSSKCYAGFVATIGHIVGRYKRPEDARMALEQMEGFELAGRTVSDTSYVSLLSFWTSEGSSVSRLCMKRGQLVCSNRTVWMKQAVSTLWLRLSHQSSDYTFIKVVIWTRRHVKH